MARVAEALESVYAESGTGGTVFVAKNNVDARGTTFGSHENYLVERKSAVLPTADEFLSYLVRVLTPFLVTRTIFQETGVSTGSSACRSGRSTSKSSPAAKRAGNAPLSTPVTSRMPTPSATGAFI